MTRKQRKQQRQAKIDGKKGSIKAREKRKIKPHQLVTNFGAALARAGYQTRKEEK